ncbi:MAG: T9SS type A sorting domain-containing protein [Ginsengibacter sp.]
MKKLSILFIAFFFYSYSAIANYSTPGTGVNVTLNYLVANSGGDVTLVGGEYYVNDTIIISTNDLLSIFSDVTVRFAANTYLGINGTIIINPPTGVKFTAQNNSAGYLGMRLDNSIGSYLHKLTFEYATSLRISDCNVGIDDCTFQYNNNSSSTSFGSSAIVLFRSNSVITNSRFLNNGLAAISGGANIANAPQIIGNYFEGNNTSNKNVPQINLGASGSDTTRILNNTILRASTRSGGIGFLPIGSLQAIVSGNLIKNNRYGLTFNGGDNINAIISYNRIDSNNIEGNPALGGSGISLTGGGASTHQRPIITGNIFTANLWGITIQGGSIPVLGNLSNADTTDDGKNYFINNTNNSTPGIDFYNNTVNPIYAQNNYWNTNDPTEVESKIFHFNDNPALGLVNYSNFILPVGLVYFKGEKIENDVLLKWQTASEDNSSHFELQKSNDGKTFETFASKDAAGHSSIVNNYQVIDKDVQGLQFYRLKMVDKDGKSKLSSIIKIVGIKQDFSISTIYPTVINGTQKIYADIESLKPAIVFVQVINAAGQIIQREKKEFQAGKNQLSISITDQRSGIYFIKIMGNGITNTVPVLKR